MSLAYSTQYRLLDYGNGLTVTVAATVMTITATTSMITTTTTTTTCVSPTV